MNYGYVRVSTSSQNIDRQLNDLHKLGLKDCQIYIDKESGKDFNRTNYKKLIKKLKRNDVLFIKTIDRLGRNYSMVLEEWRTLTKSKNVDIVVIDMPLPDTRIKNENLVGNFIADIVLQVLSFVAQNERETMKQRQKEGIKMAKLKGVKLGRPKTPIPNNFEEIARQYIRNEISSNIAIKMTGLSRGTFYRNIKFLKSKID